MKMHEGDEEVLFIALYTHASSLPSIRALNAALYAGVLINITPQSFLCPISTMHCPKIMCKCEASFIVTISYRFHHGNNILDRSTLLHLNTLIYM